MKTEETKENGNEVGYADFGCSNPEDFQKMFEKMGKCFPGQGDATNLSAMKGNMMKNMMD